MNHTIKKKRALMTIQGEKRKAKAKKKNEKGNLSQQNLSIGFNFSWWSKRNNS